MDGACRGNQWCRRQGPLAEEAAEEPAKEASKADEPSAPKKKCVLRQTGSSERG